MRKLTIVGALFIALFSLSSFSSYQPSEISLSDQQQISKQNMPYYYFYVGISNDFNIGGCTVTVTQVVLYIFNDNFVLVGSYLSQDFYVSIACGPTQYFTRSASDVSFDVSGGEITDVHFATTGVREIDDLYSNSTYKSQYLNWVKDNVPKF